MIAPPHSSTGLCRHVFVAILYIIIPNESVQGDTAVAVEGDQQSLLWSKQVLASTRSRNIQYSTQHLNFNAQTLSNEVLTARCCPYFFRVGICASDLDTVLPTRK